MEYMTISQLMMEDICAPDMRNTGIPLAGSGIIISASTLKNAAASSEFRSNTALWMYFGSMTGNRLITGFHKTRREHPDIGSRNDLVHFFANCLLYVDSIKEALAADCLNIEAIALEALTYKTVLDGDYIKLVRRWCRDNDCPDLLPNMAAFVFCRAMQLKEMQKGAKGVE